MIWTVYCADNSRVDSIGKSYLTALMKLFECARHPVPKGHSDLRQPNQKQQLQKKRIRSDIKSLRRVSLMLLLIHTQMSSSVGGNFSREFGPSDLDSKSFRTGPITLLGPPLEPIHTPCQRSPIQHIVDLGSMPMSLCVFPLRGL